MSKSRAARYDDLDAILVLARRMHAECTTPFPAIEPERASRHLAFAIENPHLALVCIHEGSGLLTAVAGDYAFSSERRTMCDVWYVLPEHRGGPAGISLVRHFIDWSRSVGAKSAYMGASTGIETEKTEALMSRLGFGALGRTFRMEL